MRVHKYRAWDEERKVVVYYDPLLPGEVTDEYWVGPLMQFTGLKDEKGQELYEGDISEGHGALVFNEEMGNERYGWAWKSLEDGDYHSLDYLTSPFNIIGNIYENPELMERATEDQGPSI